MSARNKQWVEVGRLQLSRQLELIPPGSADSRGWPLMTLSVRADHSIVHVNDYTCLALNRQRDEIVGTSVAEIVRPGEDPELMDQMYDWLRRHPGLRRGGLADVCLGGRSVRAAINEHWSDHSRLWIIEVDLPVEEHDRIRRLCGYQFNDPLERASFSRWMAERDQKRVCDAAARAAREAAREEIAQLVMADGVIPIASAKAPRKTTPRKPAVPSSYPHPEGLEADLRRVIKEILESTGTKWEPLTIVNVVRKLPFLSTRNTLAADLKTHGLSREGETPKRAILRLADEWFHDLFVNSQKC